MVEKKFKNWSKICDLKDPFLTVLFSIVDENTNFGKRFINAFPEYFSATPTSSQFPWRLIKNRVQHFASLWLAEDEAKGEDDINWPNVDALKELGIPYLQFANHANTVTKDCPLVPFDVDGDPPTRLLSSGEAINEFEWNGA